MEVIYRILNGLCPSYLNDIITVEEIQRLRCQARLLVPRFNILRYGKKSLSYLSPVLWNTLDNGIKLCNVLLVDSVPNAEYQTDDHGYLC